MPGSAPLRAGKAVGGRRLALVDGPGGFGDAWLVVIPEPSTGLLLASGLVAMAVGRRREN